MDEFLLSRGLFSGLFVTGIDWIAVFLFVAIAVLYFLAPVLGYRPERRGALITSLFLLIGYAGVALIQLFVLYLQTLASRHGGSSEGPIHVLFLFAILKLVLFILAMIMFAVGLQGLRPRQDSPGDEWRSPPPADRLERQDRPERGGGWQEHR